MSYCTAIYSEKGELQKVVKSDGTESKLFNTIVKHPLVKSKAEALAIFKNKFSNTISGKAQDVNNMKYKVALAKYRAARKAIAQDLESGKITEEAHKAKKVELNKGLTASQKEFNISKRDFDAKPRDAAWDTKTKKELPESDFKNADELQNSLENKPFGILTAENPMAEQVTDIENRDNNEAARQWLLGKGYNPQAVFGKYGNSENSFYVDGLTREDAIAFAVEFNQESVATSEGLIYQDGSYYPRVGTKIVEEADDMYTTIKTNQGDVNFKVDYNWDNKLKANGENVNYIKKSLINLDKPNISVIFADNKTLVDSEQPLVNAQIQEEIKEEVEEFQDLINCLWK